MKTEKQCKQCGDNFDCTPIIIAGEDLMQDVEICDVCCEINEKKIHADKSMELLKAIWEKTVPIELRQTDIDHPEYQKVIKVHYDAMRWVKSGVIDGDKNRLNYAIIGSHGRCKTRIVSRMARELIIAHKAVLWTDSEKFQWCCQNQFNDEFKKEASDHLRAMRNAEWLVLDDLGSLRSSNTVSDNLYSILKYRTEEHKPMIWTSNEHLDEILVGIPENPRMRSISRLAGSSNIITI